MTAARPGLRLGALADRLGLDVAVPGDPLVRFVAVSELPDPTRYVRGGELLLTAGIALTEGHGCADYVARLVAAEVAALGFGIGPIHDVVPAALATACAGSGLPLVVVPTHIPFIAVSEAVAQAHVEAESAGLRRIGDAQRVLIRAAQGGDAVPEVLGRLAEAIRGWTLLADGHAEVAAQAGPAPTPVPDTVRAAIMRVAEPSGPAAVALELDGLHADVQRVRGHVLVTACSTAYDTVDRAVTSVAVSLLALLLRESGPSRLPNGALGAALATLLRGGGAADDAERTLRERAGLTAEALWRVVRVGPAHGGARPSAARLEDLLGTPLVASDQDGPYAVVMDDRRLPQRIATIEAAGMLAGVSRPGSWSRTADALAEAGRALGTALVRGTSAIAGHDPAAKGFADVVDASAARAFADRLLGPLGGARMPGELVTTLHVWLDNNGAWDRTAAHLGVHRNTVRARIGLIERLLSCDLASMRTRAELWFALEWTGGGA
ncbi:PucR family transcriptional regulator [Yinghuangia aomiensis]